MNIATPSSAGAPQVPATLELAHCGVCGGWSFPANVPGCRKCGAPSEQLSTQACATPLWLLNFVTVHTALAPGLQVPAVIGEVALAPGLVEEARIDVANEDALTLGMALEPTWQPSRDGTPGGWVFRPCDAGGRA